MKIVHINLADQYNEGWSYQDNLLPRMHSRAGHDVTMITTCRKYDGAGKIISVPPQRIVLPDGVKLIRLKIEKQFPSKKLQAVLVPYAVFDLLEQMKPDLIMIHGTTARYTDRDVLRYMKKVNPKCVLVTDNHTCEINADAHLHKGLKHRLAHSIMNVMRKQLYPYCSKLFAITPACCEYEIKYYGAPAEKVELLPLGYDPSVLPWENREEVRKAFRAQHNLQDDDIVIVHGGKIIRRRKTPETIEAVGKIQNPKVKLIVFGGTDEEMKPEVEAALKKYPDKVIYLGHLTPEEYHRAYYGADLALFPGGQSVLWQQAIGCGLPLIVGNDKDLDYLNRGGNAVLFDDTSVDGIHKIVTEILGTDKFEKMRQAAMGPVREFFSYENIAKQVTDCVESE